MLPIGRIQPNPRLAGADEICLYRDVSDFVRLRVPVAHAF